MATSTTTVEINDGRIVQVDHIHPILCLVYEPITGTWQPMTQPGGSGGPASTVNITDAGGTQIVGIKALNVQLVAADLGLITNTVIHGLTTGGGGGYVDVKVTPSGALAVDATISGGVILADADPNPTTTRQGANLLGYNGATWDRLRSTIANGLVVDVSRVQGTVSVTQGGAWTADVTGSVISAAQSGAWSVGRTWTLSSASDSITVTGTVAISGSVAVTGPLTDTQLRATPVPVSLTSTTITGSVAVTGPLTDAQLRATPVPTLENRPATSARTSVAGAAADTLLLASNANRRGFTIYNDSTAILYLALGSVAASTTNFTVKMVADAYYEVPFGYTGEVRGIWASATGNARITEIT